MIRLTSFTGNSRAVARWLGPEVEAAPDKVVWVFPIHAWEVPMTVLNQIASADAPDGATHWMVATCGDEAGMADRQWRKAIEARGWKTSGAWTVLMPDTYICLPGFDVDPDEEVRAKIAEARVLVPRIADAILGNRGATAVKRGVTPSFRSRVLGPVFRRLLMNPALFRVSDSCVHCGACVAACQRSNISLDTDGSLPRFGSDCVSCLACLHACPVSAIDWGRFTRGKRRYKPSFPLDNHNDN